VDSGIINLSLRKLKGDQFLLGFVIRNILVGNKIHSKNTEVTLPAFFLPKQEFTFHYTIQKYIIVPLQVKLWNCF